MKILFPCPECRHPLVLPQHASSLAKLRCSVCGYKLTAESIFLDNSRLGSKWEVLHDSGSDNVFEPLYEAASLRDLDPTFINGQVLRESAVVVPPSNEWETQSSSLLINESIETDKEYQIANEFKASEVGNLGETSEHESESMPDQMIGVSDEPWFTPTESPSEDTEEQEIESEQSPSYENESEETPSFEIESEETPLFEIESKETQSFQVESEETQPYDFDLQLDDEPELTVESDPHSMPEHLEFETDEEPVLTLDDEDAFEPIEELETVPSTQETESVATIEEVKPRAAQTLPAELLGNSNSVLRSRKKSNPIGTLLSVVGGGLAAVPISILLMWYALGKDPLSAGPLVANVVPWIVPEKFQGARLSQAEKLPEMPPMVGPGFSDIDSGSSMKLPGIGGSATKEPPSEPTTESNSELSMKPADTFMPPVGPETAIGNSEPADPLKMASSTDSASVPEMPKLDPVSEPPTVTPPDATPLSPPPNDIANLLNQEPAISKIEQSIRNLNKAIQVYDAGAYESTAILFRALEAYGEQLASLPESSPERDEWRAKGYDVVESIAGNRAMLGNIKKFMEKSQGSTELFPGESMQSREPTISIDFFKIESIQKGDTNDSWKVIARFNKSLGERAVVVPHNLKVPAKSDNVFAVFGISEVDPDTRENVLQAFMAVPVVQK